MITQTQQSLGQGKPQQVALWGQMKDMSTMWSCNAAGMFQGWERRQKRRLETILGLLDSHFPPILAHYILCLVNLLVFQKPPFSSQDIVVAHVSNSARSPCWPYYQHQTSQDFQVNSESYRLSSGRESSDSKWIELRRDCKGREDCQ